MMDSASRTPRVAYAQAAGATLQTKADTGAASDLGSGQTWLPGHSSSSQLFRAKRGPACDEEAFANEVLLMVKGAGHAALPR